jgi:uncharacterized protein (DUF362 family)/ferredoxin
VAGVSVVSCTSYDRTAVFDAVSRSVELLGGPSAFFTSGDRVLVKPNMLYPRPAKMAVTTHPEVVRAAVELAAAAGVTEVAVGDSPGIAKAETVTRVSGMADAIADLPASVVELDTPVAMSGRMFSSLELDSRIASGWAVVNVAKAKSHVHAGLTLAVKNLFGCVPGLRKGQWHLRAGRNRETFYALLADIAATVTPRLNIVDAVVAMEGNGPGSGTPRPVGYIVAGADPFAVDAAAARILNYSDDEVPVLLAARNLGLFDRAPELVGDDFKPLSAPAFKRAALRDLHLPGPFPAFVKRFLARHATPRPRVTRDRCRRCGHCRTICPAHAITLSEDEPARIDSAACISCFCCQEICPHGAIGVRHGALSRIFTWR